MIHKEMRPREIQVYTEDKAGYTVFFQEIRNQAELDELNRGLLEEKEKKKEKSRKYRIRYDDLLRLLNTLEGREEVFSSQLRFQEILEMIKKDQERRFQEVVEEKFEKIPALVREFLEKNFLEDAVLFHQNRNEEYLQELEKQKKNLVNGKKVLQRSKEDFLRKKLSLDKRNYTLEQRKYGYGERDCYYFARPGYIELPKSFEILGPNGYGRMTMSHDPRVLQGILIWDEENKRWEECPSSSILLEFEYIPSSPEEIQRLRDFEEGKIPGLTFIEFQKLRFPKEVQLELESFAERDARAFLSEFKRGFLEGKKDHAWLDKISSKINFRKYQYMPRKEIESDCLGDSYTRDIYVDLFKKRVKGF